MTSEAARQAYPDTVVESHGFTHHISFAYEREAYDRGAADILRTVLDDAVLTMGDSGIRVYDSKDHYYAGVPEPLLLREWLAREADRIDNADD